MRGTVVKPGVRKPDRRRCRPSRSKPRQFRLPLGPAIPVLATLVVVWLGAQAKLDELVGFVVMVVVGVSLKMLPRS